MGILATLWALGLAFFVVFALLSHEDAETQLTSQVLGLLRINFSRAFFGGGVKNAAATPPTGRIWQEPPSNMEAVRKSMILGRR